MARRSLRCAAAAAGALACALAGGCSSQPVPAVEGWDRTPSRIVRALRGEGPLRAGAASLSLDPPYAVPMAGYFGGNFFLLRWQDDPLRVRALVLEAGGLRLAVVALDLALLPPEMRPLVEERPEFRAARVDGWTACAAHVHTSMGAYAPQWAAQLFGMGKFDPLLLRSIARRIARAIGEASRDLREVEAALGSAVQEPGEPPLSFNRKVPGGPADQTVKVVELRPAAGEKAEGGGAWPIRLVSYAAHPTMIPASRRGASADYPGVLCRDLEGDGSRALFLNGPCGDLAGGMYEDERRWWWRRMPFEGRSLAVRARRALAAAAPLVPAPGASTVLAYAEGEILLPPRLPWRLPLIGRSVAALYPDRIRARCIRIGDLALLFFPGEVGNDLGLAILDEVMAGGGPGAAAAARPRAAWMVTLADGGIL